MLLLHYLVTYSFLHLLLKNVNTYLTKASIEARLKIQGGHNLFNQITILPDFINQNKKTSTKKVEVKKLLHINIYLNR
ncbi:hypothetical protein EFN43_09055 [Pediococcus pentosaceus]|nr:hypothetical protein [Pediococcus pentosaceus]